KLNLVEPAEWIVWIVERERFLSEFERVRGIEHHGQLFGAERILARHDRARMRPVRNSARLPGNPPALDAPPRTEISADVKQNLISFHIVVHPRDLDRFRMRIEEARRERADNVRAHLQGL